MQERRRYQRAPLALSLEICQEGGDASLGKGFIKNLSEDGVGIETARSLSLGERLLFRFRLPDNESFDISGEIVYAKDGILAHAYGARFQCSHLNIRERIQQYLNSKEEEVKQH